jgi:hypothetical protein
MPDRSPLNGLVRDVGPLLYGEQWQSSLARDLGVAVRTVQRWGSGQSVPPAGIRADLMALVTRRRAALDAMDGKLKAG